jgi:hypothetical protein
MMYFDLTVDMVSNVVSEMYSSFCLRVTHLFRCSFRSDDLVSEARERRGRRRRGVKRSFTSRRRRPFRERDEGTNFKHKTTSYGRVAHTSSGGIERSRRDLFICTFATCEQLESRVSNVFPRSTSSNFQFSRSISRKKASSAHVFLDCSDAIIQDLRTFDDELHG